MDSRKSFIISVGAVGLIVMLFVVGAVALRSQQVAYVNNPDSAAAANGTKVGGQGAMVQQIMLNNANQYGNTVGQTETVEDDLNLDTMSVFTAQ
jgi:hypothetical protein